MENPFISVLIPCHNEEHFIIGCLDTILATDYPSEKIEILVIDGASSDNTLPIIKKYSEDIKIIKILSNPKRVFPSAINIGIKESKGDYIFIIGAHAKYPENYFSKCIECSIKYNADNVGGLLNTIPARDGIFGRYISLVLSNKFGVGNSKFRTGSNKVIEVDTVFGGCYRKDVFKKNGLFIEKLISTSDYEFNNRIRKNGAKIILDPDIVVRYYTRSSFSSFIKNNIRNGYWAIFPIAISKNIPVSVRHLVPLVFVLSIIALIILSLKWVVFLNILIGVLAVYLFTSLYFSTLSAGNKYHFIPFISVLFFILHITYGLGSLWGMIKVSLSSLHLIKA